MAKLLSEHDPRRIHLTFGVCALVSFAYRFCLLCRFRTSFPSWEPLPVALLSVGAVHLGLHVSSFIPRLPEKRVMHSPMIWREFRLHNAIFGSRHVLATLSCLWLRRYKTTASSTPMMMMMMMIGDDERDDKSVALFLWLVCLGALASTLATLASRRVGDANKRTTNSMAYPKGVPDCETRKTRTWYANAQFGATFFAASGSPTCAFWPLLAIELAPLMMTLVRKGRATATAYHRVYSLALCVPYVVYLIVLTERLSSSSSPSVSFFDDLGGFVWRGEPEYFDPRLSAIGALAPVVAQRLRRHHAASKLASLSALFGVMALALLFGERHLDPRLRRLSDRLLVVSIALGLVAMPFREARWMCSLSSSSSRIPVGDAVAS